MEENEKTVALLSTALDVTLALNVIGHLALAIGSACQERLILSSHYKDADGHSHLGISGWPLIVLKTRPAKLRKALGVTRENPHLVIADYPRDVLTTTTDAGLKQALAERNDEQFEYLGIMAHGPVSVVDSFFREFSLIKPDADRKI